MRIVADLHLHSHYSMSTSPQLDLEHLDRWAAIKGVTLVGTGDFTHPAWRAELREKLVPAEEGLYVLPGTDTGVRFVLSAEISSIYRHDGKVRKVHNIVLAPDLDTADRISLVLSRIGNLAADGRPILGLDARDLLEIVLSSSPASLLIPAHIWTPWFSALGSKSGFDSVAACFRDLAPHIRAVETGLSSDPPMNWMCSHLDGYTLVSNSDAHSPERLGREANLLDIDLSYVALLDALCRGEPAGFRGTVEFFPEEGKYHLDGHRKCGVAQEPAVTREAGGLCPVCGKPLTVGVLHRVLELADRPDGHRPPGAADFHSLVPLREILAEIAQKRSQAQQVGRAYEALLSSCGAELDILMERPLADIERHGGDLVAEAVRRMRRRDVVTEAGYDGEYGTVHMFRPGEIGERFQGYLLPGMRSSGRPRPAAVREAMGSPYVQPELIPEGAVATAPLTAEQQHAARHAAGPALVVAGPGTGKTRTLAHRVAHLVQVIGALPESILVATFTNRAAGELEKRLATLLPAGVATRVRTGTFHSFGLAVIAQQPERWGRSPAFTTVGRPEREEILAACLSDRGPRDRQVALDAIGAVKQDLVAADEGTAALMARYDEGLRTRDAFDLDDLIRLPADIVDAWPHGIRWLLVDEIQDVNPAQVRLIRALAPPPDGNLYAIGDPDQAIYGFRGADPLQVERLFADYPGASRYLLTQSHRCPVTVLRASAGVLEGARPPLHSDRDGPRVRLVTAQSDRSEAELVAREIERMMGGLRFFSLDSHVAEGQGEQGIRGLGDFAVLVRMARMVEPIRTAMDDHAIPYQVVGVRSHLEDEPARSVLAILKATTRRPNGAATLWGPDLLDRVAAAGTVVEMVVRAAGELGGPPVPGALIEDARPFGGDLPGFLRYTTMGSPHDGYSPDAERVCISTLHAAKGLEFPCVFIAGCEDGILPLDLPAFGLHAPMEEERRLLYVGMTRASRYLVLTHARRRRLFGRTVSLPRCRFLDDPDAALYDVSTQEAVGRPRAAAQLDLGL